MAWTYEIHELSEGVSAIVYDEHGDAVADHLTEEKARMIAAAPHLLKALIFYRDEWEHWRDGDEHGQTGEGLDPSPALRVDGGERARAAIAKATTE